jgi:hypothetical protein
MRSGRLLDDRIRERVPALRRSQMRTSMPRHLPLNLKGQRAKEKICLEGYNGMTVTGCLAFKSRYCIWAFVLFFLIVPVGCGTGTARGGPGPTWQYAALGDSLAAGVLAQEGYVPRYAT